MRILRAETGSRRQVLSFFGVAPAESSDGEDDDGESFGLLATRLRWMYVPAVGAPTGTKGGWLTVNYRNIGSRKKGF